MLSTDRVGDGGGDKIDDLQPSLIQKLDVGGSGHNARKCVGL